MKLNKKVIDSITVCGLCAMLTVTAVTNSGRSEVKAEDKVLANTGLEHTGYNSYAGVAATLFDYEKGLTAENAVTVEKENVEMVAAAQDAQQDVQPQLTQEQQEWQTKLMPWLLRKEKKNGLCVASTFVPYCVRLHLRDRKWR